MSAYVSAPIAGVGIGLRQAHYADILANTFPSSALPWVEVLADNYFDQQKIAWHHLEKVRSRWPVTFHCVGLSIGGTAPLDKAYLRRLKQLIDAFSPAWVSDHLCWSNIHGHHLPDLLPMPYTQEAVKHVAQRIHQIQDYLGQPLIIENVSTYARFKNNEMSEVEFVCAVLEAADCALLCDINNIYVSAYNHQFDSTDYLKALPAKRIKEFHLAGYEQREGYLFDTHSQPVHSAVWHLYQQALQIVGLRPTCIEWDQDIPTFARLNNERLMAEHYYENACSAAGNLLACTI